MAVGQVSFMGKMCFCLVYKEECAVSKIKYNNSYNMIILDTALQDNGNKTQT